MKKSQPKSPPRTDLPEPIRGLPEYFDVTKTNQGWEVRCKVCRAGWLLPKEQPNKGVLNLFNHAFGHRPGGL